MDVHHTGGVGGVEVSWRESSFGRMFWWYKRKVVATTVGWRRDPVYEKDGQKYTKAEDTLSGNDEYTRTIREPKKKRGYYEKEWR